MYFESLVGKSIAEVISILPTCEWQVRRLNQMTSVKISKLCFVDYDTRKPRQEVDLFKHLGCQFKTPIPLSSIEQYINRPSGKTGGLISKVWLNEDELYQGLYRGIDDKPWVHLPLIDLDLPSDFSNKEALELVKSEVGSKLEIGGGVILASGGINHFHVIGLDRLLTEDQLITFAGLCGCLLDSQKRQLVDTKWISYIIAPQQYLVELARENGQNWSQYDIVNRYATLRVSTSDRKPNLPVVVDFLE